MKTGEIYLCAVDQTSINADIDAIGTAMIVNSVSSTMKNPHIIS